MEFPGTMRIHLTLVKLEVPRWRSLFPDRTVPVTPSEARIIGRRDCTGLTLGHNCWPKSWCRLQIWTRRAGLLKGEALFRPKIKSRLKSVTELSRAYLMIMKRRHNKADPTRCLDQLGLRGWFLANKMFRRGGRNVAIGKFSRIPWIAGDLGPETSRA